MTTTSLRPAAPRFIDLFTPKLISVLREGYDFDAFRQDAVAGLTVAIVALPLSMAIAIASGVTPERGLFTAIVAGFIISMLGGSRFQIGGPAGAFIVLMATTVERHGYEGLVLAVMIAGLVQLAIGFLRLGTYIKYIPYPVTIGFTAGIAVIILASQVRDLFGLSMEREPAALMPKLAALWQALPSISPTAVGVSSLSIVAIVALRRYRPNWPGLLIAVALGAAIVALFGLNIETIGTRFGGVPQSLPAPSLPLVSYERVVAVLPDALAIALLGSIESLLSAVVADGMTGRRHRSNCELVAQGTANIASAIFGGIAATGTIARTATNIRAGARGPVAGILHSVYLLLFILVAAPLASYIPLASLGAVLAIVAWNMAEAEEFWTLLRSSVADGVVLLTTFLLTIFVDLTVGIGVGVVLGSFLLLHRLAEHVEVDTAVALDDQPDVLERSDALDVRSAAKQGIMVYRIRGIFFFGATAEVSAILDRIGAHPRVLILDFSEVPLIDSTGAKAVTGFVRKLDRTHSQVYLTGLKPRLLRALIAAGIRKFPVRTAPDVETALRRARTNDG
ncbi:MAG: SulP family inorganic anion transporter [Pseudorhodoplanes sp.]